MYNNYTISNKIKNKINENIDINIQNSNFFINNKKIAIDKINYTKYKTVSRKRNMNIRKMQVLRSTCS